MTIFQRLVLLLKVLVMLSLGISSAWANTAVQGQAPGLVATKSAQAGGLQLAESEAGKQDQEDNGDTEDNPPADDANPDDDSDSDT